MSRWGTSTSTPATTTSWSPRRTSPAAGSPSHATPSLGGVTKLCCQGRLRRPGAGPGAGGRGVCPQPDTSRAEPLPGEETGGDDDSSEDDDSFEDEKENETTMIPDTIDVKDTTKEDPTSMEDISVTAVTLDL